MTALYIVIFIFVLGILVLVHEFGHFLAAKLLGVKVEEFAFGFKPSLFSFKKGETRYILGMIPFGGFVKLHGEEGEENLISIENKASQKIDKKRAFFSQPPWKKAIIVSAGVIFNFLFAWLIFTIWFISTAYLPEKNFVFVAQVLMNSPAYHAGIRAGDLILSVDNQKIDTPTRLKEITTAKQGQEVLLTFRHMGFNKTKKVKLSVGEAPLGVAVEVISIAEKIPFYLAPYYALLVILKIVYITFAFFFGLIKSLFVGVIPKEAAEQVTGPIGIYSFLSQMVSLGFFYTLRFIGIISLSLGIFNILPLPALDGGRLVFIAAEALIGKRLGLKKIETAIHTIGFALLILLILLVSFKDIRRLIGG